MQRVVQWATGAVGRHAVAAVVDHPDLELVGVLVYSDDKAGRDAGELCGIGPIGVTATKDRDEILALDADCVLYMPQGEMNPMGALDDICALLASGKNVVSTAVTALIYPPSMGPTVVDRLEKACAQGGTSFHATGIEPGWASEVLPLTHVGPVPPHRLAASSRSCSTTRPTRARSCCSTSWASAAPPDADVPGADPALLGGTFRAPLMLVADGLGATIDDFVFDRQVAVAAQSFDVAAGRIEAGTVAAMRFSATAIIDGRPALTVEHITRLAEGEAPDWPRGRGWKVTVEGRPSMVLEAKIATHGEDENDQGCLGTAMHAVHAIAPVCAAPPGIQTFLDLPTIIGPPRVARRPGTSGGPLTWHRRIDARRRFEDAVAIVTGSSKGIGLATARQLASEGAQRRAQRTRRRPTSTRPSPRSRPTATRRRHRGRRVRRDHAATPGRRRGGAVRARDAPRAERRHPAPLRPAAVDQTPELRRHGHRQHVVRDRADAARDAGRDGRGRAVRCA